MNARIITLGSFGIGLLLITLTTSVFAAPNSVTACGTAITSSGTWTLTKNLTCTDDGVDIQASNVILMLNGFTITGSGTNSGTNGVLVLSGAGSSLSEVTILGPGTITNFQNGIFFQGTHGGGAVDVTALGNSIGILLDTDAHGVVPTSLVISQNTLQSAFEGISGQLTMSTIVGNSCSNSSDCINLIAASKNKVHGNFFNGNRHAGIVIGANISGASSTGNTVEGNQASNNHIYGVFLGSSSSGNHLIGNVAFHNSVLDINETNSHCGSDTFLSDVFGKASQACVK